MSKRTDTWMPLYIGDYLKDTGRLTTEAHGAYFLLLMDYWVNGAPPDDDEVLAAITKLPIPRWMKVRGVLGKFFTTQDGHWHQKRADQEKAEANDLSDTRRAAGKEGAKSRWQNDGKADGKHDGNAMANDMANSMAKPSQTSWQNDAPSPSQRNSNNNDLVVVCNLLGLDPLTNRKVLVWQREYAGLLQSFSFEELKRAAEKAKAQGSKPESLNFLKPIALELRERGKPPPIELDVICSDHQWRKRCQMFFEGLPRTSYPDERDDAMPKGTWSALWGPKPGEPGCLCPEEVLSRFKHVEKA